MTARSSASALFLLLFGLVLIIVGFEGAFGRLVAVVFAPGALEVEPS